MSHDALRWRTGVYACQRLTDDAFQRMQLHVLCMHAGWHIACYVCMHSGMLLQSFSDTRIGSLECAIAVVANISKHVGTAWQMERNCVCMQALRHAGCMARHGRCEAGCHCMERHPSSQHPRSQH
eukprot:365870-Chlamydomonas_euryale.AAC.4